MHTRFKLHEASIGKRCVTSDAEDATIYTINDVKNYGVRLVYYIDGKEYYAGWVDISICAHPSQEQLNQELVK